MAVPGSLGGMQVAQFLGLGDGFGDMMQPKTKLNLLASLPGLHVHLAPNSALCIRCQGCIKQAWDLHDAHMGGSARGRPAVYPPQDQPHLLHQYLYTSLG